MRAFGCEGLSHGREVMVRQGVRRRREGGIVLGETHRLFRPVPRL